MHTVREFNDAQQLVDLKADWHRLLVQTRGATFFNTPEWLETYWRHHAQGQRLRVLVVEASGAVVGILPLVVRREHRPVGPLRILTYPLDFWGSFYSPIGSDRETTLVAGLNHVRRTRRDWDVIELRFVDEREHDAGATPRALRRVGLQRYRRVVDETSLVRLPESYAEYLATRKPKWRHNVRTWQRNMARHGDVTFERVVPAAGSNDPRWDVYDECERLARRSWQGRSPTGTTLSHESIRPFLRDVHAAAARLGAADMCLLRLDGRPAAFAYNYVWQGYVFGLRIGFDAEVSRNGAGNLLLMHVVRDSICRGFRTYDLGPSYCRTKRYLCTETKPVVRLSHYHSWSARPLLMRLKQATLGDWPPPVGVGPVGQIVTN
jgi:CelD/BcsL family acetyltransferase involved in cellulose biosynthesis